MTDGIMSKILKKIALGAAIVLASWSAVAAQQTSPSQESTSKKFLRVILLPTIFCIQSNYQAFAVVRPQFLPPGFKSITDITDN